MAKARMVSTKFWSDTWVVEDLNPLDRYLFLYLLTNEKTNIIGVYELSMRTMANETGIDREEIQRMISRLESRVKYVDGWVVFSNQIKHQNYKSPKIESAIARELSAAPPQVIQHVKMPDDLRRIIKDIYGIDTVYIPSHANNHNTNLTTTITITPTITPTEVLADGAGKPARPEPIPKETIDEFMKLWEDEMEFQVGNETSNRRAIAALVRQHGIEKVKRLVAGAKMALDDRYAPRISDYVGLRRKQNELLVWGRKRQRGEEIVTI